jgi:hypothetical protein
MRTRGNAKRKSAQPARRTCLSLLLRGLSLSVMGIHAKQSQKAVAGRRLYKQDAHDRSPQVGFQPAFLSGYQGSGRRIATSVAGVKQTQFGGFRSDEGCPREQTKPIPGGWDTPLFYCSIIPPFQSDADRAKQSQFAWRCRAQLYKQTQFGGAQPRGGVSL